MTMKFGDRAKERMTIVIIYTDGSQLL
jgi:hypothetical protein